MKLKLFSLFLLPTVLSGCANFDATSALKRRTTEAIEAQAAQAEQKPAVVTWTRGAWLAGAPVQLEEPLHPALRQAFGYRTTKAISLSELASWITQRTGISVDISELQVSATTDTPGQIPGQASPQQNQNRLPNSESMWAMHINYQGTLAGLLDVAANKAGAWWRMTSGRVVFYRTLSKTFYLPALPRKFAADAGISTTSGGSGGGSAATSTNAANPSSSLSSSGGITASSTYTVDLWADLEKAAAKVAAGAQIAISPSARSITVTGSPVQVRQVEEWVKTLTEQLTQQVEIIVRTFSVKVENTDSYGWNPTVLFKSGSGAVSAVLAGAQAPVIASGMAASSLSASVPTTAGKPFDGTSLALQALSTLGEVVETNKQSVVTMNGQPILLQTANTQGYIASASTTATTDVGSTASLTPDSVTSGTTWIFLPQIANGKVVLGMSLTRARNNGFKDFASGDTKVQTKDVDTDSSQQSVSLTPGDALVLSTLTQESGSTQRSGTGTALNPVFGGGVSNVRGRVLTGVVISVRIL